MFNSADKRHVMETYFGQRPLWAKANMMASPNVPM